MKKFILNTIVSAIAFATVPLYADISIVNGNVNWYDGNNWSNGLGPNPGELVVWNSSTNGSYTTIYDLPSVFTIEGLRFDSSMTAAARTQRIVGTDTLMLGSGGIALNTTTGTYAELFRLILDTDVALVANQTWSSGTGTTKLFNILEVNGQIHNADPAARLVLGGSGMIEINNAANSETLSATLVFERADSTIDTNNRANTRPSGVTFGAQGAWGTGDWIINGGGTNQPQSGFILFKDIPTATVDNNITFSGANTRRTITSTDGDMIFNGKITVDSTATNGILWLGLETGKKVEFNNNIHFETRNPFAFNVYGVATAAPAPEPTYAYFKGNITESQAVKEAGGATLNIGTIAYQPNWGYSVIEISGDNSFSGGVNFTSNAAHYKLGSRTALGEVYNHAGQKNLLSIAVGFGNNGGAKIESLLKDFVINHNIVLYNDTASNLDGASRVGRVTFTGDNSIIINGDITQRSTGINYINKEQLFIDPDAATPALRPHRFTAVAITNDIKRGTTDAALVINGNIELGSTVAARTDVNEWHAGYLGKDQTNFTGSGRTIINGVISDGGLYGSALPQNITIEGAGLLVEMNNANTYTGTTAVHSGAMLGGTGSLVSAVTLNVNASLQGSLTFKGGLDFDATGVGNQPSNAIYWDQPMFYSINHPAYINYTTGNKTVRFEGGDKITIADNSILRWAASSNRNHLDTATLTNNVTIAILGNNWEFSKATENGLATHYTLLFDLQFGLLYEGDTERSTSGVMSHYSFSTDADVNALLSAAGMGTGDLSLYFDANGSEYGTRGIYLLGATAVIPEPSAWLLLGVSAAFVTIFRRRKAK